MLSPLKCCLIKIVFSLVYFVLPVNINRLKELLRNRLIECGWRDELKQYCKGWLLVTVQIIAVFTTNEYFNIINFENFNILTTYYVFLNIIGMRKFI